MKSPTRKRSRLAVLAAAVVTTALTAALTPLPAAADDEYDLLVSTSPDRSSPVQLHAYVASGNIYVYVWPSTGIQQVKFFVDSASTPTQTENSSPYDLKGSPPGTTAVANPFATTVLADGSHSITATVDLRSDTDLNPNLQLTATFTVDNVPDEPGEGEEGEDAPAPVAVVVPQISEPARAGYCSAPGNTLNGVPLMPGTFLNLYLGQPHVDPNFAGAVPANYYEGIGISCQAPPAGYIASTGFVDGVGGDTEAAGRIYPFFPAP